MSNTQPLRVLGFVDLVIFYLVTSLSLRWIAVAAAAGPSSLLIWIGAFLCFFIPLGLTVVSLSQRLPQAGGLYVWVRHAFGDTAGFMAGWTYWTCNLPFFASLLYFAAGNALFLVGDHGTALGASPLYFIGFAVLALAITTFLNIIGLDIAQWLHHVGAISIWATVAAIIALGIVSGVHFGSATSFAAPTLLPSTHLKDMVFWATLTFAFGGVEAGAFMNGEIKQPERTVPRAVLLGGLLILLAYLSATIALLVALPASQMTSLAGLMQAIAATAHRLDWIWLVPATALTVALANISATSGWLAACARIPFALGIDNLLPQGFGRLHPKWGTPYIALLTQSALAIIFIVLGQAGASVKTAYEVLVSMTIITYFIPYLLMFAAQIKFHQGPEGKISAILLAALGFATTLAGIVFALVPAPDDPHPQLSLIKTLGSTIAILLIGLALLHRFARQRTSSR